MPQNFPQQILQRVVRLTADGNFQREVARMLGVSQVCIMKILRRTWETGRPHQRKREGSMKISTPRNRKTVNCSEWSERTTSSRLLICECRWSGNLGGGCQFEPFGEGFWPTDIGIGVHRRPDVLGSLWSTGDAAVREEEAQSVGPQTMETLYLQWWVPVLPIPQWQSGPGAP